jgi:DNA repair exonuclease SbcCD ATPase subunit
MSDPGTDDPHAGDRTGVPAQPGPAPRRSRGWIAATAVLLLAVVALGAWALSLRSDNEDKDETISAQQQQLEEQQELAGGLREAASGVADDVQQALSGLGDQLDEIQGSATAAQEDAQAVVDQAEDAAADAQARAESAGDEVERLEAEADEAAASAEHVGACARGYLSAVAGAFDAGSLQEGIDQARSDIEELSASCSGTLGS